MQPDKKTVSMFAGFFIPMALMFFLIFFSVHLLQNIQKIYLSNLNGGAPLQMAQNALYIIGPFIFIFLLIIGRRINLRNICFYVYLLFPIFTAFWTLLLIPLQKTPHLLTDWEAFIYALGTSLWINGSFFFFWAFANNHFSFKQAGLYYPYLIILSLLMDFPIHQYIHGALMSYLKGFKSESLIFNLNLTLLGTGIVIFAIFVCTDRLLPRIRHHLDKRNENIDHLFGLDYRIVVGLFTFSLAFLLTMSNSWLHALSLQHPIENLAASMENAVNILALISVALLVGLSALLYDQRGKGWKITAYIATGIAAVSTLTWYLAIFSTQTASLLHWGAARHTALVALTPFFLILKEMSFIAVPRKSRFITKTWVDLFFSFAGFFGAKTVVLLFSAAIGPLTHSAAYICIISLAVLATLITATRIAGKRLQAFAP